MELSEVKKLLKPLGFTIQIRTLSHGRHGTIKHIASGALCTGNVFGAEQYLLWQPAFEVLKTIKGRVTVDTDKVYGLDMG